MIGFILAHEQFTVPDLLRFGSMPRARVPIAGHQRSFSTLAGKRGAFRRGVGHACALGQSAPEVWMGTSVTCPTMRYNPAVVAEAFATSATFILDGFFLVSVPARH